MRSWYRNEEASHPRTSPPRDGFKTLAQLKKFTAEIARQWLWSWTTESLKEAVYKDLNQQIVTLLMQTVGFTRDNYMGSSWKIDHCNSRMSALRNLLTAQAEDIFRDWLAENMNHFKDIKLTVKDVKEANKHYKECLSSLLKEHAQREAEKDAELLFQEILNKDDTELKRLIASFKAMDELADTEL